jgi:hypothetical protein
MRAESQIESNLEKLEEELVKLKLNTVHRVVEPVEYNLKHYVLVGEIHALKWVLEIKFKRK